MKDIFLIRHCQALPGQGQDWQHRPYIGRTDPPLTQAGIAEAGELAAHLAALVPAKENVAIVSSPARRALETARLAASGLNPQEAEPIIEQDPNLWEVDFGRWEGLCFPEIQAEDPALVDEWARGGMDFRFPAGESLSAFHERIMRAGDRIYRHPAENLMVVTHGGVIRFLLCYFLGLPPSFHLKFEVGTGAINRLSGSSPSITRHAASRSANPLLVVAA
ncbi:MAG: histidine phosphatase family protein [Gammaproteobacteria bacterium]|nr:histidine phosphatase family protein [Gammaproteobacteria bacterium]NNJ84093.1 histidine phosphatase family protein [Gammaproteobacteria bacterium]